MRALLDQAHNLESEELFEEVPNDEEFETVEEEDVFEDDFESSEEDENEGVDVDEVAERRLRREDRVANKVSRCSSYPYKVRMTSAQQPSNPIQTGIQTDLSQSTSKPVNSSTPIRLQLKSLWILLFEKRTKG